MKDLRKWLKYLKKDFVKGCGISKRKLFGKKAEKIYKNSYWNILDELKEREKKNLLLARKWIENRFKEEYPKFKDIIFEWDDPKWW